MVATQAFMAQLEEMGYEPELLNGGAALAGDVLVFEYQVEAGPLAGERVKLALRPPPDFPMTPPGGPLVSPRVLPINPNQGSGHPRGAVHVAETGGLSDPGGDWEYWSRPFPTPPGWASTKRDVRAYMGHVRTLFATLPHDL